MYNNKNNRSSREKRWDPHNEYGGSNEFYLKPVISYSFSRAAFGCLSLPPSFKDEDVDVE
jgi:hypothetical protein